MPSVFKRALKITVSPPSPSPPSLPCSFSTSLAAASGISVAYQLYRDLPGGMGIGVMAGNPVGMCVFLSMSRSEIRLPHNYL